MLRFEYVGGKMNDEITELTYEQAKELLGSERLKRLFNGAIQYGADTEAKIKTPIDYVRCWRDG